MGLPFFRRRNFAKGLPLFNLNRLGPKRRDRNEALIRGLCESYAVGEHIRVCRTLGRHKMFVDTRDFGLAPHLLLEGYWEMWNTEAICGLMRPGMIVADVGANVGYYTILMGEICGPSGHVFAFEPNPEMSNLLRRSVTLNGFDSWTSIITDPLSDSDGADVELFVPPNEPKNAHIVPYQGNSQTKNNILQTRRMDSIPKALEIELIKIDVEGAEQLVWRGMDALLRGDRLKTVLLEFAAVRYENPTEFLEELTSHGFSLSYVDFVGGIVSITKEYALAQNPNEDIMLVLRR